MALNQIHLQVEQIKHYTSDAPPLRKACRFLLLFYKRICIFLFFFFRYRLVYVVLELLVDSLIILGVQFLFLAFDTETAEKQISKLASLPFLSR